MTADDRPDAPTLAEDLLLLLFQPRSGTIAGENTLFYVLAGAVLADLALGEHLTTAERRRVRSVEGHPPSDEILRSAWDYLSEKPRGVQTTLAAIGPALREPVLERLVGRGDIDRVPRKTLGLFRTTALREGRTERRARLLADVRRVLVDGVEPQARVAALAALLSASGTLPQFHREIPWTSPVITRAKELERGDWGADAAAEAVARTVTATVVNSAVVAITVLPRV
ncbi:GOLPH3/VPS74 family protein [Micromonospora endolithica]|uniref:GPP34 family phosphoprotein n=1 Tax=Micromonospora endolithica TaxID=230091 RepID=A0A3A9ZAM5_9ACTN|nr:GPP34 family phosphoprotein [Micromonospora endolithica]RKN45285.1 GPP34 family phosphoprotein [Micromonospora endolithica]TWJ23025.1 Golgi phosphoprotein 3 GPP34 [Micromonospora endolithica]